VSRFNWIGTSASYELDQACRCIVDAYGWCVYHVGSSLERRDYRDVDVRAMLRDEEFAHAFPDGGGWSDPLWSLQCVAISTLLQKRTGLPIDFQFQQQTAANAEFGGRQRNPLGVFVSKST